MEDDKHNRDEQEREPTMRDLFNLMSACATKNDITELKSQITAHTEETTRKINKANERIDRAIATGAQNTERIDQLETSIEILKQEQLKNNVCISGIPEEKIANNNTADLVKAIAKTLDIELSRSNFTSYPISKNKLIIVNMFNVKHKQALLSKIRSKRSLMVEEVFNDISSNGQIYLNDHLTPHFTRLFLSARNAKKNGQLASVTSYGGKIRVRRQMSDVPTIINTDSQLQILINPPCDDTTNTEVQNVESNTDTPSTSKSIHSSKKSTKRKKTEKDLKNKYPTKSPHQTHSRTRSAQRSKQQDTFDANRALTEHSTQSPA